MKRIYNIIVFAIFLICSKQEYNIDLSNMSSNSNYNDIMQCTGNEDLSTCTSVSMKSGVYQCCRVRVTTKTYNSYQNYYKPYTTDICSIWVAQQISDKDLKIAEDSFSESAAFLYYAYNIYVPLFELTYTCKSKIYTFNYQMKDYTSEEIAILKDENYCLRLYYEGLSQLGYVSSYITKTSRTSITKNDCMNAKMLPNSDNYCSYASFTFKLSDQTTKKLSTCLFTSSATFSNKNLDKRLEEDFSKFKMSGFGDNDVAITSFNVEITNKKGQVLKYDSLTKTLTGNSKIIKISKIFLLSLIFILL